MYGKKKQVGGTRTVDQLITSLVEYVGQRGGTIVVPSSSSSSSCSSSVLPDSSSSSSSNSIPNLHSTPSPTDYLRAVLTDQHRHDKWAFRVTLACGDGGHIWSSKLGNLIVNKTWCRQCARDKRTIDDKVPTQSLSNSPN